MFHVYAARFDVIENLIKFWVFGACKVYLTYASASIDRFVKKEARSKGTAVGKTTVALGRKA